MFNDRRPRPQQWIKRTLLYGGALFIVATLLLPSVRHAVFGPSAANHASTSAALLAAIASTTSSSCFSSPFSAKVDSASPLAAAAAAADGKKAGTGVLPSSDASSWWTTDSTASGATSTSLMGAPGLTLPERIAFARTLPALPALPSIDDPRQMLHVQGTHALGAEKAFLINLGHREDRRITSAALAQAIGLDVYFVRASTTSDAHVQARAPLVHDDRALGGYWPGSHVNLKEIACWASHAILWQAILDLRIKSALVMEDDIDLEYDAREVMQTLAPAFAHRGDIIYLGHCDNPPGALIATVKSTESEQTYALHEALHPSCTTAYIMTESGARKVSEKLKFPSEAVDDHLVDLVTKGELTALSIHPPLAVQRPVDDLNPSDITPDRSSAYYHIKTFGNLAWEAMRGVRRDTLTRSALLRGDLASAKDWLLKAQDALQPPQT